MKLDIAQAQSHAITTDAWTSMACESFITTTIHYMDSEYTLQARVLDTKQMLEAHTADNLKTEMDKVIDDWGVEVSAIVTDNAANIVNACAKAGYPHIGCFAHTLNLCVGKGIAVQEASRLIGKCRQIVGFFKKSEKKTTQLKSAEEELELDVSFLH